MKHLEVSGAVRHIYIYVIRLLKVKQPSAYYVAQKRQPYSEPDKSSPRLAIPSFYFHFNIILPSTTSNTSLSFRVPHQTKN